MAISPVLPHQWRSAHRPLWLHIVLVSAMVVALAVSAAAAPRAKIWPHWEQRDPTNTRTLDHDPWDRLVRQYVVHGHPSGINRFHYAGVTPADRQTLQQYLTRMQAVPISTYHAPEQKAYWINLYNALTISVVVQHYPTDSIRNINLSSGLFSKGPWTAKLLTIEGQAVSLNDIEHRILRPIWRDPRVHYAVNCASLGCPNLPPAAYTAANVEQLLEQGARAYVNHPRGARFENGALVVSSIYQWFKADFGNSTAGILQHLQQYAEDPLREQLRTYQGSLKDDYDWRLNGI